MKKRAVVLLVVVFYSIVFGQDAIRIKYSLDYKIDSLNLDKTSREMMVLDLLPSEKVSYFRSELIYQKDSVLASQNPMTLLGIKKPHFFYTIYKDLQNNTITAYEHYTSYKFKVNDEVSLKWEIQNDKTKEILGQKCHVAITKFRGRSYEAWFTTELPFSDGPYKFVGLPGVILELYDSEKHYHFQAWQITKRADYKAYLDASSFKPISKKDFKKFLVNVSEKPSIVLQTSGIQLPPEAMQKYDKNHRVRRKSQNNPIELSD